MEVSDRFVVLRDGRQAGGGITADTPADRIVSLMIGGAPDALYPRRSREIGDPILSLDGLEPDGLGQASFTLHRGEIFGIAGLLGSGRTRLLRALFGLDAVKRGDVTLSVYRGRGAPADWWARGMGMLSENRKDEGLAGELNVADNMTLSRLGGLGPGFFVWPSRQRAAAGKWIERLGIKTTGPSQRVAGLSGGSQQKVALARLLYHDVDVLVLDEPTRGIDVGSKAQIYSLIDDQVAAGKSVLLVSSYFPELLALCDRIAVMSRGKLGAARPAAAWSEHALLLESSGVGASSAHRQGEAGR